jgi:thioredoxin reductase
MTEQKPLDVIIIGGSYAGLSAALALGRSLREVLVIDSGQPCNWQTPHSHNFLTQDGVAPAIILSQAKNQLLKYGTVKLFVNATAVKGHREGNYFSIVLETGDSYKAKKLLFATGVKDILPNIDGLWECWGISVLHCPYCHGYEVRHRKIGLLGNGDLGFELARLLSNWTQNLVLFTNGTSVLSPEQRRKIAEHGIGINEHEISHLAHHNGQIKSLVFKSGESETVDALFARGTFEQNCRIPLELGCGLTEQGYLKVDDFQRTTVAGIYAAGDNTTMYRAVSAAVAAGSKAGALLNKELIDEAF